MATKIPGSACQTWGMTAKELLQSLVDNAGFQLTQCFSGVTEEQADLKLHDDSMSFRVTAAHLAECCFAVLEHVEGREHKWGTFEPKSAAFAPLVEEWQELRARAVAATVSEDEKLIGLATDYIVGHDFYHVGQLVALRLSFDKDWNSYSIYGR